MRFTKTPHKEYLGDSVYADIQGDMILLTTENGYEADNAIFLDIEVYRALLRYVERVGFTGTGGAP